MKTLDVINKKYKWDDINGRVKLFATLKTIEGDFTGSNWNDRVKQNLIGGMLFGHLKSDDLTERSAAPQQVEWLRDLVVNVINKTEKPALEWLLKQKENKTIVSVEKALQAAAEAKVLSTTQYIKAQLRMSKVNN